MKEGTKPLCTVCLRDVFCHFLLLNQALQDEHTSEQAKAHAREILEAAGYHIERPETSTEEEHNTRVLAGYKAALSSEFSCRLFRLIPLTWFF